MKTLVVTMMVLFVVGCGSELGAGAAGVGAGALLQNTIAGAKADLDAREQTLIAAYNEGVAIGMKTEDLESIKKELAIVRQSKMGVEVGEQFLGLDWNDPKQTGMAFSSLMQLGLIIWGGNKLRKTAKELRGTNAGINKFSGLAEPSVASSLHDTVKAKINAA